MKTRRATSEETPSGFYNYPLVLEHEGKVCVLEAGTSDHLKLTKINGRCLVESRNYGLGYTGLQVIDLATMETVGRAFDQESSETSVSDLLEAID